MTQRPCLLAALLVLPLLAGCATYDGSAPYLGGAGDPVRGAALNAPFQFGALPSQRGQPAKVALSLAQLELLADRIPQSGYWQNQVSGTTVLQLRLGQAEARKAIGVPANAPAQPVIDGLRAAAAALEGLDPAGARAALDRAPFTLGGAATLQRLTDLPPLPQAAAAAGQVNNDVMGLADTFMR